MSGLVRGRTIAEIIIESAREKRGTVSDDYIKGMCLAIAIMFNPFNPDPVEIEANVFSTPTVKKQVRKLKRKR